MNKLRIFRRLAAWGAVIGGTALLVTRLPIDTWAAIGERVALAAVSLRQADAAATRLSERLERLPAEENVTLSAAATRGSGSLAAPTASLTTPTTTEPAIPAATPPAEDGSGGRVIEQVVGGGSEQAGLSVKNKSGVTVDLPSALSAALPYTIEFNSDQPQVLIYHTHATETYMPYDAGYYNAGDTQRVPENQNNVRAVGDALAAALTAAGVNVLHDTTLHDYPQYRGAYDRSAETVEAILKKYPSIKVVLDIHRDGLMANDTDKLKPTVTIDGQKAAQVMVVCGTLSTDSLPHKNWEKNLAFAARLQKTIDETHDGLARPLSLVAARYNQYLSPGALLIEVGSEGNTLAEAQYSARLLARALVSLWTNT